MAKPEMVQALNKERAGFSGKGSGIFAKLYCEPVEGIPKNH